MTRRRVEECERCKKPFAKIPGSNTLVLTELKVTRTIPRKGTLPDGEEYWDFSRMQEYNARLCRRCARIAAILLGKWVEKGCE